MHRLAVPGSVVWMSVFFCGLFPEVELLDGRICMSLTLPHAVNFFCKAFVLISVPRSSMSSPTIDSMKLFTFCPSEESELASCFPTCSFTHRDHTLHSGKPGNPVFIGHFVQ